MLDQQRRRPVAFQQIDGQRQPSTRGWYVVPAGRRRWTGKVDVWVRHLRWRQTCAATSEPSRTQDAARPGWHAHARRPRDRAPMGLATWWAPPRCRRCPTRWCLPWPPAPDAGADCRRSPFPSRCRFPVARRGSGPAPVPRPICPKPDHRRPVAELTAVQLVAAAGLSWPTWAVITPGLDCKPHSMAAGATQRAPSFHLFMSQMDGYTFLDRTASDCEPTLILRNAYGSGTFNDDGPTGIAARLEIDGSPLNAARGHSGSAAFRWAPAARARFHLQTVSARADAAGGGWPDPRSAGRGDLDTDRRSTARRTLHNRKRARSPAERFAGLPILLRRVFQRAAEFQLLPVGHAGVRPPGDRGRGVVRTPSCLVRTPRRPVALRRRFERQPQPR